MIPVRVLAETEERYRQREGARAANSGKLATGDVLAADSPERVQMRLARLARAGVAADAVLSVALERVLGGNDLVSVSYLDLALLASRTVGRVLIRTNTGQALGSGSGFMVSPSLLLTNNHVLESSRLAAFSQIEFNYQAGIDGEPLSSVLFDLEPDRFFLTDRDLDYSLVAVSDRSRDRGEPLAFGWNRLIEELGKVIVGEFLNIIQHPNGEPKQLALRENQLVDVLDNFMQYETDTAPGSSGSPVFNDQWEVVALHHSGVPRRDDQGRILARDSSIWTEDMGEQRIDWIANEGVRISRVVRHVRDQHLSGESARLRDEMFRPLSDAGNGLVPIIGESPGENSLAVAGAGPIVGDDGSATWTLPIQITVRVGQTPSSVGPWIRPVSPPSSTPLPDGMDEPMLDSQDLREALAELEAASTRPYYDEASDLRDRDAYYAGLDRSLDRAELFHQLSTLLEATHKTKPNYKPAVHVYPWVDLHPDRKLRSIYSGDAFNPADLIREDFRIEAQREHLRELLLAESTIGRELQAAELDLLEARLPFNCEHVVPQSYFEKQEPMRGDLHHLFACETDCNSFRGNIPYFDFTDFMEAERTKCGKRVGNRFEPEAGKGAVARATLYFLLRYPGEINRTANEYPAERLRTLVAWHNQQPVTTYERHRNAAIREKQGNRNPLIDFPELAEAIDFTLGLG